MTTSDEYTEKEEKGGDDNQVNGLISRSRFELLYWLIMRIYSPLLILFDYFIILVWIWISL